MVSQPRQTPPKRLSGTARNSLGRAVAGNLPGLLAASHTNGRERPAADYASGDGGALCRAPISPYPYPSETGDRRFWAILWPVDAPKCLRGCPETASEPLKGSMTQPYAP